LERSISRGDQGEWLGGFARNVGMCNAFTAELLGVVEGLCLAQRLALTKIELCIDSQAVIQVISTGKIKGTVGNALIKRIKGLLALNNWEVQISHVYREANRCADALTNIGCSLDHNVIFYDTCPDIISDIMLADLMGITTPRMIVF
jgi:ribonuclease HI